MIGDLRQQEVDPWGEAPDDYDEEERSYCVCDVCRLEFDMPRSHFEEDAANGDPPICASCQGYPSP